MPATVHTVSGEGLEDDFWIEAEALKDEPPMEWFIDKLIPRGGVSLLFGPPNGGKSLMALDLAIRVVLGRDWGGRATQQSDVLYVATEGARAALHERIEAWRELHGDDSALGGLVFYTRDISILERTPSQPNDLDHIIGKTFSKGYIPNLVIIDTLNYAISGDENDNTYMGQVAKYLSGLNAKKWHDAEGNELEYRPTVLLVHHTPKANFQTARGASALEGAIDTSLNLTEVEGLERAIKVYNKKNRYASKGGEWHYTIRDDEHDGLAMGAALEYKSVALVEEEMQSMGARCEAAIPLLIQDKGPMRRKDIVASLADSFSDTLVDKSLAALKRRGTIVKQDSTNKNSPYVVPQWD